jgi:hypothetical protein
MKVEASERCESPRIYLPLARRIAEDVDLSDAQLLTAIAGNGSSFHSVILVCFVWSCELLVRTPQLPVLLQQLFNKPLINNLA